MSLLALAAKAIPANDFAKMQVDHSLVPENIAKIAALFRDTKTSFETTCQDAKINRHYASHLAMHMKFYKQETDFIAKLKAKNIGGAKKTFTSIPEFLRTIYLQIPDKDGRTSLHWVTTIDDDNLIDEILKYLPEDKLGFLRLQDKRYETSLHWAVKSLDENRAVNISKKILLLLPIDQKVELCQIKGEDGNTPFHWAAQRDQVLKALIERLSESKKDLFLCLKNQDNFGSTLLHIGVSLSDENQAIKVAKTILEPLASTHRAELMNILNQAGSTPLHMATRLQNIQLAKKITIDMLTSLLFEDRLICLQIPDKEGVTSLHWSASLGILDLVLDILKPYQRALALRVSDRGGSTPIHWLSILQKENISRILELIPEENRLSCLNQVNNNHLSPMDSFLNISIDPILKVIPRDDVQDLYEHVQKSLTKTFFRLKRKRDE